MQRLKKIDCHRFCSGKKVVINNPANIESIMCIPQTGNELSSMMSMDKGRRIGVMYNHSINAGSRCFFRIDMITSPFKVLRLDDLHSIAHGLELLFYDEHFLTNKRRDPNHI